jgi:hypothetical protein
MAKKDGNTSENLALDATEVRMILHYRALRPDIKLSVADFVAVCAGELDLTVRKAPALRLVVGGAA